MGGETRVPVGVRGVGVILAGGSGAVEDGDGGEDGREQGGPQVVGGVAESGLAPAASGEGGGNCAEPVAEPFRFPLAGVGIVEGG